MPWPMCVAERCLMNPTRTSAELARIRARLKALEAERVQLLKEAETLGLEMKRGGGDFTRHARDTPGRSALVTNQSPASEKVALFRHLFAGRDDVFAVRWESVKTGRAGYSPLCWNEWVRPLCGKPKVKCSDCPNQKFIPFGEDMVARHLRGEFVAGVYPILSDDTVRFLAVDFDKDCWAEDATALLATCRANEVPAALERSRSGKGGHVWIFFTEPVSARTVRQFGSALITQTMDRRPEIGFASYDRLFPSQDTRPVGGFGNLIALPLQHEARQKGNSVFVDTALRAHEDQWTYLSSLKRLSPETLTRQVETAERAGRVFSVRLPVEDEHADQPWELTPSRSGKPRHLDGPMPPEVKLVFADQVYIERAGRERHEGDIVGDFEVQGGVPSGLVEHDDGMGAGLDDAGDLFEVSVQRLCIGIGHDKAGSLALVRADGPEDIG